MEFVVVSLVLEVIYDMLPVGSQDVFVCAVKPLVHLLCALAFAFRAQMSE